MEGYQVVYSTLAGEQYDQVIVPRNEGATTKTTLTGEWFNLFILFFLVNSFWIINHKPPYVSILMWLFVLHHHYHIVSKMQWKRFGKHLCVLSCYLVDKLLIAFVEMLVVLQTYWKAVRKQGSVGIFFLKGHSIGKGMVGIKIMTKGPGVTHLGYCNQCCLHSHSSAVNFIFLSPLLSLLIISVTIFISYLFIFISVA